MKRYIVADTSTGGLVKSKYPNKYRWNDSLFSDYIITVKNLGSEDLYIEVSKLVPYDDAEYYWAKYSGGVINYIYEGSVIKRDEETPYLDEENSWDYVEYLVEAMLESLEIWNQFVEPVIVRN